MTKRLSKKGQSMTLKDFYDKTPDASVPIQFRLPSKPGVSNLEHKLGDLSLASGSPQFSDKYSFNTSTDGRTVNRNPGHGPTQIRSGYDEQAPNTYDKAVAYAPGRSDGQFGAVSWRADERLNGDSGIVVEKHNPPQAPYGYPEYPSHAYPVPPPRHEGFYSGQAPPPPPPRVGHSDPAGSFAHAGPGFKASGASPPFEPYSQPPPPPPRRQPDQKGGVSQITTALASNIGLSAYYANSKLVTDEKPADNQATKDQAISRLETTPKEKRKSLEQTGPVEARKQQLEQSGKTIKTTYPAAVATEIQHDSQVVEKKADTQLPEKTISASGDTQLEEVIPEATSNPWAEKMAAAALARMAHTKSSLIVGSGPKAASAVIAPAVTPATPVATAGQVEAPALGPSADSAITKPSHPFERPRLSLKPRSAPGPGTAVLVAAPTSATSQMPVEPVSDSQRPKLNLQPRSVPVAATESAAAANGRPKLNLQPRTKAAAGSPDGSPSEGASRAAAVFGSARPREEVLKERSVEVSSLGSGTQLNGVSRTASLTSAFSEDIDNWQTVAGKKTGRTSSSLKDADENTFSFTASKGIAIQPRSSANGEHPFQGYGSYGSSHAMPRGSPSHNPDDDPMFRRNLPIRHDPYF